MRPEESWSLAIDVGTTFCVVAARRGQGEPQVVEIGGQRRVPSVIVVEDDGTLVVGQAAENLAAAQPARALRAPRTAWVTRRRSSSPGGCSTAPR
ncbi:MAG: Hsp70 family protein [Acidimicrobiales bacterium]